jgi:hypothetical protein
LNERLGVKYAFPSGRGLTFDNVNKPKPGNNIFFRQIRKGQAGKWPREKETNV